MKTATKTIWMMILITALLTFIAISCGDYDDDDDDDGETGTLEFYANGEDFIRDGFVGKTGWNIAFDHFYVTLEGPTGFQVAEEALTFSPEIPGTDEEYLPVHAGHPHDDIPEGAAHESLTGTYWLDLHDGPDPLLVDKIQGVPVGNYNYVNFAMVQADEGDYAGYSIIMIGTATKDAESVQFTIKLTEQMTFSNCHQEVDDENAGVVTAGGTGSVEMTFHSDHLFGDFEDLGNADGVNPIALGFQPFADLAEGGVLDIDQDQMADRMEPDDYATFFAALYTLGHSGEGHCEHSDYVDGDN